MLPYNNGGEYMSSLLETCRLLITTMQRDRLPVKVHLHRYEYYYNSIPVWSLIPPENQCTDQYTETAYVFMIGSYVYYSREGTAVTWFERRSHAVFSRNTNLYKHTLCIDPKKRFQTLSELEICLDAELKGK